MLTTQHLVERSLAAFPDRIAIVDQDRGMTYREVDQRSARIANALVALGASGERPVAIFLPNDFHFIEIDAACMRAGITRVGISSRLSPDECQFIVSHSGAAVLISTEKFFATLDRTALDARLTVLLVDGGSNSAHESVQNYEHVLDRASTIFKTTSVPPDHPAYVLYTSGTTGRPKGATHTQGSRVAAMVNMLANEIVATGNSAMVHCAPLTHGSGSKMLTFMALGARNVILPRFDPEHFAESIKKHGGTHSFMVPTMFQMLVDAGASVRDAVRSMQQISFGGAPITNMAFARALDAFGPILTQVYGTCEAPHPVTVMRPDDYAAERDPSALAETAGRASFATEIKVVDDDGAVLPINGEGELLVRGEYVMQRYWRDDRATADVFDADGWYKTGDIAVVDQAGFVRFKDRKRDLIISGGLNIYPSEVERVLAPHPNVREVAVIGYPDERWGESVMACIVPVDPTATSEHDVINWLEGRIAGYKKPRRIIFMNELPKGTTNKVLKRALREKFWEGRSRSIN
jgi:acyl-CoA synthetase (AMP-forming)/AMP-acid ligase II